MSTLIPCPVCQGNCAPLDVVDFNKSCEEIRGGFLDLAQIPIYYFLCDHCQFCFAPEFTNWTPQDFAEKIYNQDYILVDPDYRQTRPRLNAKSLISILGESGPKIKHLDYGGGNGLLSKILGKAKWQSTSYDPFVDKDIDKSTLGPFDLITAFEVFEHVPDVNKLITDIFSLLKSNGVVLFSTLISDSHIRARQRINWWYAAPRNGHVSLYSKKSLSTLGARKGFDFHSFSDGFHAYWQQVPEWAGHLLAAD